MNEFMMLFHYESSDYQPTPEEFAAIVKKWQSWIGGLVREGSFVSTARLEHTGKMIQPGGVVTDGPYAEVKEMVGGNIVVKTATIDDAVAIAHGCPVLEVGGRVEVRPMIPVKF
ncbi:MAG: YciI family protein [Salibacteraceae bacterium]